MARVVRTQRSLASALLALFPRTCARVYVSFRGGDEHATTPRGGSVHSVLQAQLSLDHVVHEIVWDIVIVPGRRIQRARGLPRQRYDH
ncbi:MAG TPA: hypothetical protein VFQ61_33295 [Polyangiaceae bacterium]|nr:hypothetical protein [Polyangiaceae bacterium]